MSNFRFFVNKLYKLYNGNFIVSSLRKYLHYNLSLNFSSKSFNLKNTNSDFKFKSFVKLSAAWLGIFSFFKRKESEPAPENLLARAIFAIQDNKLPEGLAYLNRILMKLEVQYKNEEITIIEYEGKKARIYSEISNVYLLMQDHNKAEETIIQTMKSCFAAGLGSSHPTIIELSLKLAMIYAEQKKYADADIGFKFTIENCAMELSKVDIDEDEVKNLEALLAMCYNYYSKFLYQTCKYQHALKSVVKAMELAVKIYGRNHQNVINLINDEAIIHLALQNYKDAQLKFQEAIDICLACPGDEVIEILPSIYVNFGKLYIEMGNPEKAEEMCNNSIRYWRDLKKELESYTKLKLEIDDCYMRLAGLRSLDRDD